MVAAGVCNALAVAFNLSERVFMVTDRIAQYNLLNIAGTILSLTVTVFLARIHGTVSEFVVAYYLGCFSL